MEATAMYMNRN